MYLFSFQITDHTILVKANYNLEICENFKPFQVPVEDTAEYEITVCSVDNLPEIKKIRQWYPKQAVGFYKGYPCILHRVSEGCNPHLLEIRKTSNQIYCVFKIGKSCSQDMVNLFKNIGLETVLRYFNALILHSSFIRWQGKGILFSAPSGTGKSTQADLWAKYKNAEILNGDRAGLRKVDGCWTAYGLPYAGTSGIYRNESAPVSAIVMLEQAPENSISPLNPAQALRKIWPEFTVHRWDPEFTTQSLDLALDLLASVPVYLLRCLPDEGAVQLLHNTISHEV